MKKKPTKTISNINCPLSKTIERSEIAAKTISLAVSTIQKMLQDPIFVPLSKTLTTIEDNDLSQLYPTLNYGLSHEDINTELKNALEIIKKAQNDVAEICKVAKFDWADCIHQGKNK